jgi:H+/Cl- antiporter ClcA
MANVLGLLAFVAYVILIVGLAAGITWLVVRLTPPQKKSGGSAQS